MLNNTRHIKHSTRKGSHVPHVFVQQVATEMGLGTHKPIALVFPRIKTREMSRRSLLGEVYNKVGRVLGTREPKKQKFSVSEEHLADQEHAASALDAHAIVKKRTEALKKEFKRYR